MSSSVSCEKCGDSGYLYPIEDGITRYDEIVVCDCMKVEKEKERLTALIKSCEFPPLVEDMTFDNFKTYPAVEPALKYARDLSVRPGELFWLSLLGGNGVGKTHLAVAICKAWVKAGIPARYAHTALLLDELREGFSKKENDNYDKRFKYFCTVPLLLLDDLGVESKTAWVQEKLETLVDYRLMYKLSLIITSNKSLDELPVRISSRLMRLKNSYVININAEDYCLKQRRVK